MNFRACLIAALFAATPAFAQTDIVTPPAALVLENVPPIPSDLAKKLDPYGEFRPHGMLSWNPNKREMLIRRRLNATNQVHLVTEPGAAPVPLTDYPDAVQGGGFQPRAGRYFVFAKAEGGNEVFRGYRQDLATKEVTPFTPDGERVSDLRFSRDGTIAVYSTQPVDKNNPDRKARTIVHITDPAKPAGDRVLATLDGGGWGDFRFSEDKKRIAMTEFISATESYIWVMDAKTGTKTRITNPPKGETVLYDNPEFTRDGKGIFVLSDSGAEFRRLVLIPSKGGAERVLTEKLRFDVDGFSVSFDANRIAFLTNENGSNALRFIDLANLKELPRPPLEAGVISGLHWREKSSEIAFSMTSARSAGDVFSYDVKANKVTRWTNGNNPALNTSEFVEPRLIKWKSFDGLEISGFHYHPPAKFTGKRPVIINIHGGPEAQYRPGFIGRNNYYINELGVAVIFPNVRGSAGFGKTFLKLDNGMKRKDSVADIGALIDWIKQQPDLDGDRIMITGGSYGGYMTFACAVDFSDKISGSVAIVGISNFVTFLERTESYRRDLRRVEYGDERDPEMRAWLEKMAPLNNADKIGKPILVVQGKNDPRVPYTEAVQIVETLKKRGTPVWFILANDEGHGFAKKPNADYQFYATVEFARQTLLK
ncbi:MAG TPA: prolyl oligopeptidase family serine peptidase [Usitatibacter sp.]|nr:prolyl oligopeptidase family serine peptidase [Usitatibacter sp.]